MSIHDPQIEVFLIRSCSEDRFVLEFPFVKDVSYVHTRTMSHISKSDLIGRWIEVFDPSADVPTMDPNTPPNYNKVMLEINDKSLARSVYGQEDILNWDMSQDGKRIHFIDNPPLPIGEVISWKIISLTEGLLRIEICNDIHAISSHSDPTTSIIQFQRMR